MSQTFSLVCRETNLGIWIGQGQNGAMTTLYSRGEAAMDLLRQFLNDHKGMSLEFVCDDLDSGEWDEYEGPR